MTYGPGAAERISGTHLLFNLHYQTNGHETTDKTRVGIWLQKGPVTHATTGPGVGLGSETFIVNGTELTGRLTAQVTQDILPPGMKTVPNIPAGADNYRLTALLPIREEMVLYSIQPHMHLRGKSMKYTAVYPDGREEELLNVPHYDFNWQIVYEFAKPVTLPAGTTVRVEATWDNSTKNKYNPRPDQEVFWGEQSWDEMFSPILRGVMQLKSPITPTCRPCKCRSGSVRPQRYSMNQSSRIVWLLVAAAVGSVHAQGRGSAPNPDQLPIVESVGCLSQTGADWNLANATEAATSTTSFTTPEAVKAAAEKPLGTQQYRLLGTSPFSPERHKGHKMAVKGILIKSGSDSRINVTSFQMLAETCGK